MLRGGGTGNEGYRKFTCFRTAESYMDFTLRCPVLLLQNQISRKKYHCFLDSYIFNMEKFL